MPWLLLSVAVKSNAPTAATSLKSTDALPNETFDFIIFESFASNFDVEHTSERRVPGQTKGDFSSHGRDTFDRERGRASIKPRSHGVQSGVKDALFVKFAQDGVQGHLLHFDADVLLVGIRWLGRPSHISRVREQGTEGLRDALAVFRPSDSGSDDDVQSFIDAR